MIVTLTPNPSIDATLELEEPLGIGAVNRASTVSQFAGGKGVNVSHALRLAGDETVAVFPANKHDAFITITAASDIPFEAVPMDAHVRMNTTITDDSGVTTKVNGPGPMVSEEVQSQLIESVIALSARAEWVVMAGSLPQGMPTDWYSQVIAELRARVPHVKIAVDTSDKPMKALGDNLSTAAPDLIKPNSLELGQLTGTDGSALETAAEAGDFSGVVAAARQVNERGVPMVLVTLGSAGAALVTKDGAWIASPPPVEVRSTVGAGDSSLAGFIMGVSRGLDLPGSLANAVAYGTAAAGLPGTTMPNPEDVDIAHTSVAAIEGIPLP